MEGGDRWRVGGVRQRKAGCGERLLEARGVSFVIKVAGEMAVIACLAGGGTLVDGRLVEHRSRARVVLAVHLPS